MFPIEITKRMNLFMIVIISKNNDWSNQLHKLVSEKIQNVIFLNTFTLEYLESIDPEWIFFLHWSEIVQEEIFGRFKCVVVHIGNLPDDRGGSPIQNQIMKGSISTIVNLIEMKSEVDSGGIYLSEPITLQGNLNDIWSTIAKISSKLIVQCVENVLSPIPQFGIPTTYKRKKDNKLIVDSDKDISYIYDQIRMLDGENYPSTYIEAGKYKLEFSRAKLENGVIISDVRISEK